MAKLTLGTIRDSFPLWPTRLVLDDAQIPTHKHIMGKAGMGKSKLLESIYLQLIRQGIGVTLLDPHGDSAEAILTNLIGMGFFRQPGAFNRLLYVELRDEELFLPFNILKQSHVSAHNVADDVLQAMHRAWPALASGYAPQFDTMVLSGTKILIDNNLTLPALQRVLTDREYRDRLLANVEDHSVLSYFHDHFDHLSPRDQAGQIQSTLRRVFLLSFAPVLEYSLGQSENRLDFRRIIDEGTCVLLNLGHIQNEDAMALLGCLITRGYERAALSRDDLAPSRRRDHHLLLDEFATFAAKSEEALGTILSQTRKFGLFSCLAHQSWGQLGGKLQGALQNVQVDIALQIGPDDAHIMAKWFGTLDPVMVKAEPRSPTGQPVFMPAIEQWQLWEKALGEIEPRYAWVKVPKKGAVAIRTLDVPTYKVDPEEVQRVKERYRKMLMVSRDQVRLPHREDAREEAEPRVSRRVPLDET